MVFLVGGVEDVVLLRAEVYEDGYGVGDAARAQGVPDDAVDNVLQAGLAPTPMGAAPVMTGLHGAGQVGVVALQGHLLSSLRGSPMGVGHRLPQIDGRKLFIFCSLICQQQYFS